MIKKTLAKMLEKMGYIQIKNIREESIISIHEILTDLNKNELDWAIVPGYYSIKKIQIKKNLVKPLENSIVLKTILNKKTGEIKSYVAKFIDDKANKLLS